MIVRAAALFLLGVLLGHLLYPSGDPVTVQAAVPDRDMPLWLEPSSDLSDAGDSDEFVGQVQGRTGSSVGWGVAEEPVRPTKSESASSRLTSAQITSLARVVTRSAAFSEWIGPVAHCESTGRAMEEGEAGERGLTQIHPIHRPWLLEQGAGYEWERQYEPEVNLRTAFALWERDGGSPWESTRGCWG